MGIVQSYQSDDEVILENYKEENNKRHTKDSSFAPNINPIKSQQVLKHEKDSPLLSDEEESNDTPQTFVATHLLFSHLVDLESNKNTLSQLNEKSKYQTRSHAVFPSNLHTSFQVRQKSIEDRESQAFTGDYLQVDNYKDPVVNMQSPRSISPSIHMLHET